MICFGVSYYLFIPFSMVELPSDGGSGAEDLEDPGYLADQGKQPFDHIWAYVILHASKANTFDACDHKYR